MYIWLTHPYKRQSPNLSGALFSFQATTLRDTKVKRKTNKAQNMYSENVEIAHTATRSQFTRDVLASRYISFNIRQTKKQKTKKNSWKSAKRRSSEANVQVGLCRKTPRAEATVGVWHMLPVPSVPSVLYFSWAEQSHAASFSANQVSFKIRNFFFSSINLRISANKTFLILLVQKCHPAAVNPWMLLQRP